MGWFDDVNGPKTKAAASNAEAFPQIADALLFAALPADLHPILRARIEGAEQAGQARGILSALARVGGLDKQIDASADPVMARAALEVLVDPKISPAAAESAAFELCELTKR